MRHDLAHVVIIPDGNRRWARAKGLRPHQGHEKGFSRMEELMDACFGERIRFFSLWGASIDNLTKRDAGEIDFLLSYLERRLRDLAHEKRIHENKVRIRVLGFWEEYVPVSLQNAIREAQEATASYDSFSFTLFLAYDGKEEMRRAVETIVQKSDATYENGISPDTIKKALLTYELPPVDLLIRTGGEPHLSGGFMMWDVADAQLYFSELFFPDFDEGELKKAIRVYGQRERRFGA